MKQKYLLSMLIGGALLTACSMDDDLNPAKVAQDVNPSAPVFTIGFENGGSDVTRAYYDGNKVVYQDANDAPEGKADLMSLYHGIKAWDAYQNAVYRFDETDAKGKLTFTTAAMVQEGTAVMVYPADTTFANKPGKAPVIKIEAEQTMETMAKSPYMSAGLEIGKYEEKNGKVPTKDIAGYGKTYDILMKPAASYLRFTLKATATDEINKKLADAGLNKEEDKIKIESIELDNGEAKIFTTKASIVLGNEKTYKDHSTWKYPTSLTIDETSRVAKMTGTSDDDSHVYMAMLPFAENTDFSKLKIVVKTTYGDVTISGKEAKKITFKKEVRDDYLEEDLKDAETNAVDVATAFEKVIAKIVEGEEKEIETFKNEYMGQSIQLQVEVDLDEVDMSEMHIKNNADLVKKLKIYNALKSSAKDPAKFYLDGVSNTNTKFILEQDGWTAMLQQQSGKDTKGTVLPPVEFIPCNSGNLDAGSHNGNTIQLKGQGDMGEMPDLAFDGKVTVPVELNGGTWTWTGKTSQAESKKLMNYKTLTVLSGTTLNVQGTIQRYQETKSSKTYYGGLETGGDVKNGIINEGIVNVIAETELRINTENFGTINVGKKDETDKMLTVAGNTVLTNREVQNLGTKDWAAEWEDNCGKIYNWGTLAVNVTDGKETNAINNYGVIYIKDDNATTLVTNNADDGATTGSKFVAGSTGGNRIGSIVLCNKNSKKTHVGDDEKNQGFIKWTVKGNATTSTGIANYVIIDSSDSDYYTGDNVDALDNGVKYLEIKGDVDISFANTLDAIVICEGTVSVPRGSTITLNDALYLKSELIFSGILKEGKYAKEGEGVWNEKKETYFGTTTGKIYSSGGGSIEKAPKPTPKPEEEETEK